MRCRYVLGRCRNSHGFRERAKHGSRRTSWSRTRLTLRTNAARVFASALGITAKDWRYLHDQILAALPRAAVRGTRITPFGVAYEVVVIVDGLNGRAAPVATTWMVQRDAPPRRTSTWVDIP